MELDVREVAAMLHVPEYTVYRLINEDQLPASQINGQLRFSRAELLEWANAHSVNPMGIVEAPGRSAPAGISLVEALTVGGLLPQVSGTDRESVLRAVVENLALPDSADRAGLLQMLAARERAGSTIVGHGIAIPHSRFPVVLPVGRPLLALCYLAQPVEFGVGPHSQVNTLFVLVTPTIPVHLQMLARLAALVQDSNVQALLKARAGLAEIVAEAQRIEQHPSGTPDQKRAR